MQSASQDFQKHGVTKYSATAQKWHFSRLCKLFSPLPTDKLVSHILDLLRWHSTPETNVYINQAISDHAAVSNKLKILVA